MKKAINLNAKTTVKLNDIGLNIYNSYINRLINMTPENMRDKFNFSNLQEGNILTSELWDIIHIFGEQLSLGKDTPFIDNCIHVEVQ